MTFLFFADSYDKMIKTAKGGVNCTPNVRQYGILITIGVQFREHAHYNEGFIFAYWHNHYPGIPFSSWNVYLADCSNGKCRHGCYKCCVGNQRQKLLREPIICAGNSSFTHGVFSIFMMMQ